MKLRFYSEVPNQIEGASDFKQAELICKLSEKYNFDGSLILYVNDSLDPWILATKLMEWTDRLIPLVAVQPYYLSPVATAKMLKSISVLYKRKVNLNFVSGGRQADLVAMNELTERKDKYSRLEEYIKIFSSLICSNEEIDFDGTYYKYKKLATCSEIYQILRPEIFVSGTSQESINIAQNVADTALLRPQPLGDFKNMYISSLNRKINIAIRISVIARETSEKAWNIAKLRYAPTRLGKLETLMRANSLSNNIKQMAKLSLTHETYDGVYWAGALFSGKTIDPYLVGSYSDVARYLKGYVDVGVTTFLLGNIDDFEDEVEHFSLVREALEGRVL